MPRRGAYGNAESRRGATGAPVEGEPYAPRSHSFGMGSAPAQGSGWGHQVPPAAQPGQPGQDAYAAQGYYALQQPYGWAPNMQQAQGYRYAQAPYGAPAYAQAPYGQPAQQVPAARKRRRKGPVIAGIAVALLAIAAAILLALTMCGQQQQSRRAGDLGQLDGKSAEEIQAELDRVVSEGMFNISIASFIQFPSGTDAGDVRIENVPGNPYLMQVVIRLDDTGEVVYTTDVIEQNHHIQQDTLDVDLPAGTYNATATFTALDPETEEEVGSAAAKVVLQVLS